MFNWLTRWRRKARDIFEYHDGVKTRWIDPLVAQEAIFSDKECIVSRDCADADTDDEAFRRVLAMTCNAFKVNAWTESTPGLTRDEINTLLSRFFTFMAVLKKKHARSRTPSEPMDTVSPATDANSSTTPPESESFSTPSEQNGVGQTRS